MAGYSVHANIVHPDGLRARMLLDALNEAIRFETIKPNWVETWHDDKTLMKVRDALLNEDMSDDGIMVVINAVLNAGILFRERVPE